jgi:hypothetical protein
LEEKRVQVDASERKEITTVEAELAKL